MKGKKKNSKPEEKSTLDEIIENNTDKKNALKKILEELDKKKK
jgi:hypothetical protein